MIAIVVTLEAKPGCADALIEALAENAQDSRQEPGCLKWEFSRHLENPDKFAIYEVYQDKEAVQAHYDSAHFKRWFEKGPALMASKESGRYEILD